MVGFRFIHTADWQLGKPFGGFPADLTGELKAARRDSVKRIASLARERGIGHIVVAGDVWDSEYPAQATLAQPLELMGEAPDVDWWLMPGNHDLHREGVLWSRVQALAPDNVHLLTAAEPTPLSDGVFLLPAPWTTLVPGEDLTAWMDSACTPNGAVRIGVAHGGVKDFGSEAVTIDPERARKANLDYLALGDWHGLVQVNDRTWYSGTPEPDRFVNNDRGNVLEVEIDAERANPSVTPHRIGQFDWRLVEAELRSGADFTDLETTILGGSAPTRSLVKLTLTGRLTLSERAALETVLAGYQGRLLHLDICTSGLQTRVTTGDLDTLDSEGSVRKAAETLRAQAEVANGTSEDAKRALELLFSYAHEDGGEPA